MSLDTTKLDKLTDFMSRTCKLLKNEDDVKTYEDAIATNIKNAKEAMADNEEKYAHLYDAVTRWVNQLVFALFREGSLTPEIEAEYRAFEPVADTSEVVREYFNARQEKINKINEEHGAILREQKGIEIFRAIISGKTKEEAQAALEAYEQQLAQAQAQAVGA